MEWTCHQSTLADGQHTWEFFESKHGEEWDKCIDCGEIKFVRYIDSIGG